MFYVLAFPQFHAPETARHYDRWRHDFDVPHAIETPAYVTLVFGANDAAQDHVTEISTQTALIRAQFNILMIWPKRDGSETLLFGDSEQGAQALTALHRTLHTGPLHSALSRDHPFVPHITLGHLPTFDAAETARAQIAPQLGAGWANIIDLTVVHRGPPVETRATYPLGRAA